VPPEDGAADHGQGFAHLGDEERFRGWRISLVDASFSAPDGTVFHRDVVRHPGAVAVVAVTDRQTVVLVRQYRGALDRWLLEIPAGTRDVDGEAPETTAARELEEEAGVCAAHLEHLATVANSPGFCDELTEVYLATGISQSTAARHGHEEEGIEVVEVPLDGIETLVADGRLVDAQTILGVLLARARFTSAAPGRA
jgi:ADP-ribose pyrophosphatase